jgi:hypothetical protein
MSFGWWLLQPLLFGLYFVLTLAGSNTAELNGWSDLVWPISVSLLVCVLCCGGAFAVTREPQKAAVVGLLWFAAFSVYGYVAETLRAAGTLGLVGAELGLGVLFVTVLFGPSLAIHRSRYRWEAANHYLGLVAVLLLGYTTVQLWRGLLWNRESPAVLPLPTVTAQRMRSDDRPDVYLIILDKYTGGAVLQEHFGFDNSAFEGFLRSRGFVVPRSARANYPMTLLALASMLNFDYIQNLSGERDLYELVEKNRLAAFLKSQGYRFAFFPTGYRLTARNREADLQLSAPDKDKGELAEVWVATTMLPELVRGVCALTGCEAERILMRAQLADIMDWKFQRMKDLSGGDSPTFVLAHLLLPHEPYLYNADCSHREPYWPAAFGLAEDGKANKAYIDQIRCANRKIAVLVDSILARSRRPPVILLQADHGHGRMGKLPRLEQVKPHLLRERMSVFSAYLLPGLPTSAIADSISPVNAVRLVLRHYWGADLPPLEDVSYWAQKDQPLRMTRIHDQWNREFAH